MGRMFVTLLAFLFLALTELGQTPPLSQVSAHPQAKTENPATCSLTPAQAPAIRGIKLGMSTEELLALFPGSSYRPEIKQALATAEGYPNYGVVDLTFLPAGYADAFLRRFAGVRQIDGKLFDGQVAQFRIAYIGRESRPSGPLWHNVEEFVSKLSESLALPAARDWQANGETSKILKCNGFEIIASIYNEGGGDIMLRNTTYMDVKKGRAAVDEEKQRREFKP
jgi:hypothetical protein